MIKNRNLLSRKRVHLDGAYECNKKRKFQTRRYVRRAHAVAKAKLCF